MRDPVVLTATLPRFLLPGDRSTVHLDLDNVEGAAGDYTIAVTSADGTVVRPMADAEAEAAREGARRRQCAAHRCGRRQRHRAVSVSGPGGFALERSYALTVRPPTR